MSTSLQSNSKPDPATAANAELLDMDEVRVDPTWALRIPANLAIRRQLLPYTMQNEQVLVACKDVSDLQGLQAIQRYVELPVLATHAESASLERSIESIFLHSSLTHDNVNAPARVNFQSQRGIGSDPEGEDIVALGDEIFHAALIRQATDIHIEPGEQSVRIRIRVDGSLEEYRTIPNSIHAALVSRLKVLAGMDIAERRAPQDGRFTIGNHNSKMVDVRAATIPTKRGERMTLRLLAMKTQELTLEKLGQLPHDQVVFERAIEKPNGLITLTGPTGCGKSTTLYAAIRHLIARRSLNVITIEDPVEYVIEGISQVEVDSADKVNFHKALRSLLRHDPDVIMIGEIRDEETAEIAIKAALTGHLVFSTLHTNSARDSVTRLIDMGIQPFLLAAVARLFVAQRLVRKICQRCRQPRPMTEFEASHLGRPDLAESIIYESVGCNYCAGTGFAGRTGLFELVSFEDQAAHDLNRTSTLQAPTIDFESRVTSDSRFLVDDAIEKLKLGITSFDQVAAVINIPRGIESGND